MAFLITMVFSEYLPLFEDTTWVHAFPIKFARERIPFLTDHLKDPILSTVCVYTLLPQGMVA